MQKQKKKQPFFTVAKEWNLKKYVKKTHVSDTENILKRESWKDRTIWNLRENSIYLIMKWKNDMITE